MIRAVITGASSGLGKAIAEALPTFIDPFASKEEIEIIDWSRETGVDIADYWSIIDASANISIITPVDILVNCAGINEISMIDNLTINGWDQVLNTNARGIFLVTKALLPSMRPGSTILNIISNASNVPMTGSIAYNASKGAAKIMTMQMHRELFKTHGITVFGISPNKLSGTGMSEYIDRRVQEERGWTPEEAKAYQLASLPVGEETDTKVLAEFVAFLLSTKERHKYLGGCILPYGGPM
jgi:NAD(P)-dependent dehydrogenase (short-subunit alcohol dehydrogenase family)